MGTADCGGGWHCSYEPADDGGWLKSEGSLLLNACRRGRLPASRNTRGWRIRCFNRIGHRLSPVMAALGVVRELRRHIAVLERVIAERQER